MKVRLFLIFSIFLNIFLFSVSVFGAEYLSMELVYDGIVHKYGAEKVTLVVEDEELNNLPMPPVIFQNLTLVPAREVFEKLGAEVLWDSLNYEVTVNYNKNKLVLKINDKNALLNDNNISMDLAAKIINNKTMIPLRFVSENLGFDVNWDSASRTASVNSVKNLIEINSIDISNSEKGVYTINASDKISDYKTDFLTGNRLVIDFYNTLIDNNVYENKGVAETINISDSAVEKIRTAQNQTSPQYITRVVFDFNYGYDPDYNVSLSNDEKSLIVNINKESVEDVFSEVNENIYYSRKEKSFVINKRGSYIDINKFTHSDDYNSKKYTISMNQSWNNIIKDETIYVNDKYINSISIKSSNGNTEITFDEKQILTYNVSEDNENIYIRLQHPKLKYKNIVVLDAGHGGSDPGASGYGLVEKDLTVDIVNRIMLLLEDDNDIKGYATRTTDVYPSFTDRNDLGNAVGDVFISIHINSAGSNTNPNGTEVYYLNPNTSDSGMTSKILAETLQKNLLKELGSNDRKTKTENFIVLRQSNIPASLCEIGFVTNPEEAAKLGSSEYRQKVAQAVYNSLKELFKLYPTGR